jgi:hypothetical protein
MLAAALAATLLAACGLGSRPYPLVRTFTLDPPAPDGIRLGGGKSPLSSLIVTAAPPPGAYEGKKLVYRLKSRELSADFYNELSAPPARAVADGIAKHLELTEPSILVVRSQGAQEPDWVLEIGLLDIYGDLTKEPMTAELTVTATLSDLRRSARRPVFARDFMKSLPAVQGPEETMAEALVRAYSEEVSQIAEELRPEIRRALLGRR